MSQNELAERLASLRSLMRREGAAYYWLRATDIYLNEYVPTHLSRRAYITGFTGSLGDAIIGLDSATLFVDGRYALQAKDEATCFEVQVLPLGESIESACLKKLSTCKSGDVVIVEDDRIPKSQFDVLQKIATEIGFRILADDGAVERIRSERSNKAEAPLGNVWRADTAILGTTLADRLAMVRQTLQKDHVDGYLLVSLDDIAWISGFRSLDFDNQSTFAARAIVLKDKLLLITPHPSAHFSDETHVRSFEYFEQALADVGQQCIGFDPSATPQALVKHLESSGASLKALSNPVLDFKVHKVKSEISHLHAGFKRADDVVFKTQQWVCEQVMAGKKLTEADVSDHVSSLFEKSGTVALSFKPICGYNKNGAIIHHTTPDTEIAIKEGGLFLLDTGGIYESGYSTDLTRTFLVGDQNTKASPEYKQMFTLVLKASINGMSARFPVGTTGVQLDAIVRAPLWQLGLNFAHGTGHGLGINVHEFPPRIATFGHAKIDIGHVFSIEPGLYIPNFAGVRIENLCTVVADPAKPGYLRVLPLTFAPLDERLIDFDMLTSVEVAFLEYFKDRFSNPNSSWETLFSLDAHTPTLILKS